MATLKTIRKRISATSSTKKLTRAMRMIATARLRKAQTKVLEARTFNFEAERILSEIIKRGIKLSHPLLNEPVEGKGAIDLVVFTSDRGLCGPFNENLLAHVKEFIREKEEKDIRVRCLTLGRKGRDFFKREQIKAEKSYIHITESEFKQISGTEMPLLQERFINGETDEVIIAFNKFKGVSGSEPKIMRLLPATPPAIMEEYCIDYIYEPFKEGLLGWLVEQSIKSKFQQAYLETAAGELAARMVAMDKATKNAEELIDSLTTQFNRARQSAITKDLIDIVGGAEALK